MHADGDDDDYDGDYNDDYDYNDHDVDDDQGRCRSSKDMETDKKDGDHQNRIEMLAHDKCRRESATRRMNKLVDGSVSF